MDIFSTSSILTIVLFVLGIIVSYYIAKYQMRKNKIVHFFINEYDIGKGLSDEFPNFNLHYGNEHLKENVKVFKGGFINVGRNDISGLNGKSDINLFLPDDYKIIDISVYPATEDLKVEANVEQDKENQVNFGIGGILKSKEYFKYTIITEAPKDSDGIRDLIKFKHRIPNTEKISNTFVGLPSRIRNKKKSLIFLICYVALFSILSISLLFMDRPVGFKVLDKATLKEVSVRVNNQSEILVKESGVNNAFGSRHKISSKELAANYIIMPNTSYDSMDYFSIVIMPFAAIFLIICLYYHTFLKNSQIIRIIMMEEGKIKVRKTQNVFVSFKRLLFNSF